MKFATTRFGEIEVDEAKILHLPEGIIGFPDFTRAVLLDHQPNSPFRWLQAVDRPELAFVVIDPLALVPDYPLDKLRDIIAQDNGRPEDIAAAAITTVPQPPAPITVNLTAPIVFDLEKKSGAQIILHDPRFKTRHLLVQEETPEQKKSEKEEKQEEEGRHFHRMERSHGSFQRTMTVPFEINADDVAAEFKNGVLTVTLSKPAEVLERTKKIEVKQAA